MLKLTIKENEDQTISISATPSSLKKSEVSSNLLNICLLEEDSQKLINLTQSFLAHKKEDKSLTVILKSEHKTFVFKSTISDKKMNLLFSQCYTDGLFFPIFEKDLTLLQAMMLKKTLEKALTSYGGVLENF